MLGVLALLSVSNILAAIDRNSIQILDKTETFDHINLSGPNYSGLFSYTSTFRLYSGAGSVDVSIIGSQLAQDSSESAAYCITVSDIAMIDSGNFLYSTGVGCELFDAAYTMVAGPYERAFGGNTEGDWGRVYNTEASAVPLPAAIWLFGAALVGFVAYSARRSV
jgi:hypothetical protein